MTIQKIAKQQKETPEVTLFFRLKNTSDCLWFDIGPVFGTLKAFSDTHKGGRAVSLDLDELASTEWCLIHPSN